MRMTKIVCTLGPSVNNESMLLKLISAGMDVARINFSHGTHEEHAKTIELFRKTVQKSGRPIPLMLDTKGPEIRVGTFKNGFAELSEGDVVTFTPYDIESDEKNIKISYNLSPDISTGDRILIDDGLICCRVVRTENENIICEVENGGRVSDRKSINVPDVHINMPYISARDEEDLKFGIRHDIEFVAASFVRCAADVLQVRKILDNNGGGDVRIIAKIENRQGVDNIDEIIDVSDGIMVARGDMGVEIPFEELPAIQKMLIKKCFSSGKVAITATQLLDSMMRNPRPTRAETTDVANAVYDGTSAVMLSGETAVGKYPAQSVATMAKIVCRTESSIDYKKRFAKADFQFPFTTTNAICHASCTSAHDLGASAIISVTWSGYSARQISRFRPACPIIAPVMDDKKRRQLNLSWGVLPCECGVQKTTDELIAKVVEAAQKTGIVNVGDVVVITAGIPVGIKGNTNFLKVHLVGNVLVQGQGVGEGIFSGNLCVAKTEHELRTNFNDGDIVVVQRTTNDIMDILKRASGVITEEAGISNHTTVVAAAFDIPVIVGAENATDLLKSGTNITMDCARGLVVNGAEVKENVNKI